jgi:hypothetical protein
VKITAFWVIAICSLVEVDQRFRNPSSERWRQTAILKRRFTKTRINGAISQEAARLCGLAVSVEDYKHRGPGFDSRALLRIFLR